MTERDTEHLDPKGGDASDSIKKPSRLARWSRRKAEQQKLDQAATDTPEATAQEQTDELAAIEAAAEQPTEPVLSDADMPPIESLGAGSDFSGFMSPGVSEELRKLALRKMFSLPSYHIRDGLDDYDDDYTIYEPLGDTPTRDPWSYRQAKAAERQREAEAQVAEQQPATADDTNLEADTLNKAEPADDNRPIEQLQSDNSDQSDTLSAEPNVPSNSANPTSQDTPNDER